MIPANLFVNAVVLLIHSPFLIQFSSSTSKSPTPENSISRLFLLNAHKRDKKKNDTSFGPESHDDDIYKWIVPPPERSYLENDPGVTGGEPTADLASFTTQLVQVHAGRWTRGPRPSYGENCYRKAQIISHSFVY